MKDLTKQQAEHLRHVGELGKAFLRQYDRQEYNECVVWLAFYFAGFLDESDIPFAPVMEMIRAIVGDYLFGKKQGSRCDDDGTIPGRASPPVGEVETCERPCGDDQRGEVGHGSQL